MAYAAGALLLLIAMTIAANLHPEGPALVILLFWATPALLWGLILFLGRTSGVAGRGGGALLLWIGIALKALFFRLL